MCKHDANWTTTTFCRKCRKLRCCYKTKEISIHSYMCKECSSEYLSNCRVCGREGLKAIFDKQDGCCGFCLDDEVIECELCGAEGMAYTMDNGICYKCSSGINQKCSKCETYVHSDYIEDGLCEKCRVKVFKKKYKNQVDDVFSCIECGREQHISQMKDGLCVFCYQDHSYEKIKSDMKKVKKRAYSK